jgi:hypothetical protein
VCTWDGCGQATQPSEECDGGVRQAGPPSQTSCNRTPIDRYAVSGSETLTAKTLRDVTTPDLTNLRLK